MAKYTNFQRVPEFPEKPIYKLDMKQFAPLLLLKNRIEYLDKCDLGSFSYTKINGMVRELLLNRELHLYTINPPQRLFRGRIFDPDTEKIAFKKNFWYPQKEYVKKRGRVNSPGQSIFYATDRFENIFNELDIEKGQSLVIAEVKLLESFKDLKIINLGLSRDSLKKIQTASAIREKIEMSDAVKYETNLFINGIPINDYSEGLLIENFFHKYMSMKRDNKSYYKITNAISSIWFEEPKISGIAYPNIRSYSKVGDEKNTQLGTNFAFVPEIVDKIYSVANIWTLQINFISKNMRKVALTSLGCSDCLRNDDEIIWKNDPEEIKLPLSV